MQGSDGCMEDARFLVLLCCPSHPQLAGLPIGDHRKRQQIAVRFWSPPLNKRNPPNCQAPPHRLPRILDERISIAKRFSLWRDERLRFLYRADFFNLFNRTNFGVNGAIDNPDFGKATGPQSGARIITMGLRLEF